MPRNSTLRTRLNDAHHMVSNNAFCREAVNERQNQEEHDQGWFIKALLGPLGQVPQVRFIYYMNPQAITC